MTNSYLTSIICINTKIPDDITCGRCNSGTGIIMPLSRSDLDSTLEAIVEGTIEVPADYAAQRRYVMQQQLFEMLQSNPSLLNQSASLQSFIQNNQWTGLDFIYFTGYYLSKGNMDAVNLLLSFWPNQTNLDNNYYKYFDWLAQMYDNPDWQPSQEDVLELANKCPLRNGVVVYAARNLYNAMTRTINHFQDDCNSYYRGVRSDFIRLNEPTATKSKLVIYPNPAKTSVNVLCNKMKQVELLGLFGRKVITKMLSNTDKTVIDISTLQKGLFLIKVITTDNNVKIEKLIVE